MQVFEIVFAQVDAVEQDLAFGRIVEARDQLDDRRLALAVFADQRHALSGAQREIEVLEDPPRRPGIGKRNVAKFEASA